MSYHHLQWVVQKNLTQSSSYEAISAACQALGIDFWGFTLRPFATEAPEYPKDKAAIFYGSTSLMNQVYPNPGLFYDPALFSMENYLLHYADRMLNYEASLSTLALLLTADYPAEKLLFIRPDADSKSFSGTVMAFADIQTWANKLGQNSVAEDLHLDTPIVVGPAFHIKEEWRLWIVDKKVVAASQYAYEHRLHKVADCPDGVKEFATAACEVYVPHDIFVMDICRCGEDYYIVECGCLNSAGFYSADIRVIVAAVSDFMVNSLL
jgi:hypothetical protein